MSTTKQKQDAFLEGSPPQRCTSIAKYLRSGYTLVPLLVLVLCFDVVRLFADLSVRRLPSESGPVSDQPDFSHLASHCADIPSIPSSSFVERQDALARTLHSLQATAYVAEPGASAGFFANLSGAHWHLSERPLLLIIQPQTDEDGIIHANVSILTPAFEETRAKLLPLPSASGITFTAWAEDADPYAQALSVVPRLGNSVMFVDGGVRTFITDGLQSAAPDARVMNAPVEIRRLRERKSTEELNIMKCVNEVTLLVIRAAREHLRIGMRESQAGALVVNALTAAGLKEASSLTLFGENAALPHGSGTNRILGKNDFVLIDCGGSLHGYSSDVTRTFALSDSDIPGEHQEIWHLVQLAQQTALSTAGNGTVTAAVDHAARKVIRNEGLGQYFTHRLGHGIGLEVHESPYLRGGTDDIILTGHTFSDEPGVYIEGKVGVRLEDCFYIDADGTAKYLTEGVGGAAVDPWHI